MPTIVAVAIGQRYQQATINAPGNIPAWARKYINGFVNGFPHTLGTHYTIDYRECPAATLSTQVFTSGLQADYILCLSTTVVREAARIYPASTRKPIIGLVSRPQHEAFHNQANVCGVSAERSDDARNAYGNLLDTVNPALTQATVLHDPNYTPSRDSLQQIQPAYNPTVVQVQNPADVQNAINAANAGSGVLLLPVDWMFASAPAIVGWASNQAVLDFWFATDWVVQSSNASAFGGYGVPQETCGHYLAQQLDVTWNGRWPNPAWVHVKPRDRVWMASQTRANNAGVRLNTNPPPRGPVIVP